MLIFIRSSNGDFTLEVESVDTIKRIKQRIEELKNIKTDLQQLNYEDNLLENEKTISQYNMKENAIVQLILKADKILDNEDLPFKDSNINEGNNINMADNENTNIINIRVKNYSQTFFFEMKPTDTVLEIKKKILAGQGVDVEMQRIISKGKELQNDASMADLGTKEDELFWLMLNHQVISN